MRPCELEGGETTCVYHSCPLGAHSLELVKIYFKTCFIFLHRLGGNEEGIASLQKRTISREKKNSFAKKVRAPEDVVKERMLAGPHSSPWYFVTPGTKALLLSAANAGEPH